MKLTEAPRLPTTLSSAEQLAVSLDVAAAYAQDRIRRCMGGCGFGTERVIETRDGIAAS
jgi:hypothetical protein